MSSKEQKRLRAKQRRAAKKQAAAPVGFRNPPKHTQFKPGQSGNPSGRPKAKKTIDSILEARLMAPMTVTIDGKRKKLPALEILLTKELSKAMNGDQKSVRLLLDLFQARGLAGPERGSQEDRARESEDARERLRRKLDAALGEEE
jgi:hypothetical protein